MALRMGTSKTIINIMTSRGNYDEGNSISDEDDDER